MSAPGAGPGGLPSLSELLAWSTTHLIEGAAQLEATADRWDHAFVSMWKDVHTVGWNGTAANGAKARLTSDKNQAAGGAEKLRAGAQVARSGASDVLSAQNRLRYALEDAAEAEFNVYDDGTVEDTHTEVDRSDQAQDFADRIYQRAKELVGVDSHVGQRLKDTVGDIENDINFHEPDGNGVQLVGSHVPLAPAGGSPLSEARRRAVEYADHWAGNGDDSRRHNPDYKYFGDGGGDCTNFASQAMRAGGFKDVGNGLDDWRGGDIDDWYYNNGLHTPLNSRSNTWSVAQDNRDFITQSGRGEVVGTAPTQTSKAALDPLAPSKAGLQPGDMIYYRDPSGVINHTAVYVGQKMENGHLVDVVDQHAGGGNNFRNDWMPETDFYGGRSLAEFVHLHYPGE